MAAEPPKSSYAADSYIDSLISLKSKSEIRYEGVLYSINTEESSIGLRNVKSSPPIQATSSIDNDPAIIQSHYPPPPAPSTSLLSTVSASPMDVNSHASQLGLPGSNFPGGIPLYQPSASLGSWGPSPPSMNGNSLPMPMYWPGMYGPPNGLPHLHQQTMLRPPLVLSGSLTLQQPMPYPGFNAPPQAAPPNVRSSNSTLLPTSSSTMLAFSPPPPAGALNVPSTSSPLFPNNSSSATLISTSLPSLSLPAIPSVTIASQTPSSSVFNKVSNSALPSTALNVGLPKLASLTISDSESSSINPPVTSKVNTISSSELPYKHLSQAATSITITSSSSANQTEVPTPSLVTPDQLLQSAKSQILSQPSQSANNDVEVVQVSSSSEQSVSVLKEKEAQPPTLPLPPAPRTYHKPNGAPQVRHNYRGSVRGRGTRGSRPVTRFTVDFDFTAMNEKFNKDEVWGHLGKSNKSHSKNKEGDEDEEDCYEDEDEDDEELSKIETPVYNKDDFFDTLSSNALRNESQNGQPRFSEQLKIDTETFGEFARHRGGRGGRGYGRGGHGGRGLNYGRGYGYSPAGRGYGYAGRGRGRGCTLSGQAS